MTQSSEQFDPANKNIAASWQQILGISQSMQQSANDEEWLVVSTLSTQRHQEIEKHFQQYPVGPSTAGFYYQHLSQFLANEDSIQALANNARKLALKSNLKLVSNKKAVTSYKDIHG